MLTRAPLAPKVLTVADAELLWIEIIESIAHVLQVLIIEHLVEAEWSEVVIE